MIDPVTGSVALIGTILDAQAKNAGIVQAQQGLDFQRQQADRENRAATATRVDAYGNTQQYDPVTNTWKIVLDPTQERLVKSGEREQLLSLTDDAARNRQVREQAFQRGQGANQDFNTQRAKFNYDTPPSEGSIADTLTSLLTGSARGAANRALGTATAGALRGNTGMPNAARSDQDLGSMLPDIILKARGEAHAENATRNTEHNNQYLPVLASLQQTAGGGGGAPIDFSNTPDALRQEQNQNVGEILKGLATGATGVENANKNLSGLAFKGGPDLKGFAGMISALSGASSKNDANELARQKLALQYPNNDDGTVPVGTTIGSKGSYDDLF